MQANQFFIIFNLVASGNWILIILFPERKSVRHLTYIVISCICLLYTALLYGTDFRFLTDGLNSIDSFRLILKDNMVLLAGWIHYLAVDLVAGLYINAASAKYKIPRAFVIPTLLLTFLLGPTGLLTFILTKQFYVDKYAREFPKNIQQ